MMTERELVQIARRHYQDIAGPYAPRIARVDANVPAGYVRLYDAAGSLCGSLEMIGGRWIACAERYGQPRSVASGTQNGTHDPVG